MTVNEQDKQGRLPRIVLKRLLDSKTEGSVKEHDDLPTAAPMLRIKLKLPPAPSLPTSPVPLKENTTTLTKEKRARTKERNEKDKENQKHIRDEAKKMIEKASMIPALNPNTFLIPNYSRTYEEDRLLRVAFQECFGSWWSPLVSKKLFLTPPECLEDLENGILSYWLMLGPSLAPSNTDPTDRQRRLDRLQNSTESLLSRYNQSKLDEQMKEIAMELRVLEQRLCLEEEKFLYAKLKNEYNRRLDELSGSRKKSVEPFSLQKPKDTKDMPRILPKSTVYPTVEDKGKRF